MQQAKIFRISLILSALVFVNGLNAQTSKYTEAMKKNISILDTAGTLNTYQLLDNTFERIAAAEKTQWLAYYYAAYCLIEQTYAGEKKKNIDDIADKAEVLLNKADSLNPNNDEVLVLKARVNSCRISVNPMTRGSKYGPIASAFLDKAEKVNPNNPRIYLERGMGFFYTPKMFGGGKDKAKVQYQLAIDKYDAFKPASDILPHWGLALTQKMLKDCD